MNAGSAPNRVIAFFDGQNLFAAARDAFGFTTASYGVPRRQESIRLRDALGDIEMPIDVIVMRPRVSRRRSMLSAASPTPPTSTAGSSMKPPEEAARDMAGEWLAKADADLRGCDELLTTPALSEIAAFHAQQAAEKARKAFLVWTQVEFPKTHDIKRLLALCRSVDPGLAESPATPRS